MISKTQVVGYKLYNSYQMCFVRRRYYIPYIINTLRNMKLTEWDIKLWCWRPGLSLGQHYKVVLSVNRLSQVNTLDVART